MVVCCRRLLLNCCGLVYCVCCVMCVVSVWLILLCGVDIGIWLSC